MQKRRRKMTPEERKDEFIAYLFWIFVDAVLWCGTIFSFVAMIYYLMNIDFARGIPLSFVFCAFLAGAAAIAHQFVN